MTHQPPDAEPPLPASRPPVFSRLYWQRTVQILRNTIRHSLESGYIHAGNIAYLSLVTLLPFIILVTAATVAFGQTAAGHFAIRTLLDALPDNVATTFRPIIDQVLQARTGKLLWAGGLVALWTVSTFIETLRDLSYRAFGVRKSGNFLVYRLKSLMGTLAAIIIVMAMFLMQFSLPLALRMTKTLVPLGIGVPDWLLNSLNLSQIAMPLLLFLALWALLKLLTPPGFRHHASWPGALIILFVWLLTMLVARPGLTLFANMDLTYGALSGVMLALLFFYVMGFALVLGVHANAAIACHDADEVPSGQNMG